MFGWLSQLAGDTWSLGTDRTIDLFITVKGATVSSWISFLQHFVFLLHLSLIVCILLLFGLLVCNFGLTCYISAWKYWSAHYILKFIISAWCLSKKNNKKENCKMLAKRCVPKYSHVKWSYHLWIDVQEKHIQIPYYYYYIFSFFLRNLRLS